ncbi:MAG: ATP-binding cassette domain-containing protein [Lachnospiraceae bacterium]|nr:ATP-binding cassette domain-containing protein [Lachnospiraceae bacterium]
MSNDNNHNKIIRVENLTKTFESKKDSLHALKDVSFSIEKGDIYGIIGLSGAGKSTLVRCLNLLEKPTSGKVIVKDKDLLALSKEELRLERQKIGMIFQHFNLLAQRTVLDNICLPLEIRGIPKKERQAKAMELLKSVGLESKSGAYPSQLSGGQQQRVAIARVLANEPDILLCDEATSALDPQTTKTILDLLLDINRQLGITIVVITHEMRVVKEICKHVAVLDEGILQETGTVSEVFTNPRTHAAKRLIYMGLSEETEEEVAKHVG